MPQTQHTVDPDWQRSAGIHCSSTMAGPRTLMNKWAYARQFLHHDNHRRATHGYRRCDALGAGSQPPREVQLVRACLDLCNGSSSK